MIKSADDDVIAHEARMYHALNNSLAVVQCFGAFVVDRPWDVGMAFPTILLLEKGVPVPPNL